MPILINPVQPPFLMPPPDGIEYNASLGDNAYRQVMLTQHDGAQATFDIFPDGETDQGLRVTLLRGTNRIAAESNGFTITFETGTANASLTSADKEGTITMPDGSLLSAYKTQIDNNAGMNSEYFGGETGTSAIATTGDLPDATSAGATHDRAAIMRIMVTHNVYAHPGTSAPSSDAAVRYIRAGEYPSMIYVPAGDRLWLKRDGGTDAEGSAELWVIEGGG